MDPKIIVPVVAAVISLGGAIASSVLALRGQRRQYFGELRKWGDEVCNTLSEAVHVCDLDPAKLGQEKSLCSGMICC